MPSIAQSDPIPELAQQLAGPQQSGIAYLPSKCIVEDLTAGLEDAFAFAVQNPENVDCLINKVIVDVTTVGGTGSSVLDVDVVADATSTGADVIDGLDLDALGVSDSMNGTDNGTDGIGKAITWDQKGGTLDYLTGKILVANASNLVGVLYIYYTPKS